MERPPGSLETLAERRVRTPLIWTCSAVVVECETFWKGS